MNNVTSFSMSIYACCLLDIYSFFPSLFIGPPLATTLLNLYLIIDNNYLRQMKITTKILEYSLPEEKCVHYIAFSFLFLN